MQKILKNWCQKTGLKNKSKRFTRLLKKLNAFTISKNKNNDTIKYPIIQFHPKSILMHSPVCSWTDSRRGENCLYKCFPELYKILSDYRPNFFYLFLHSYFQKACSIDPHTLFLWFIPKMIIKWIAIRWWWRPFRVFDKFWSQLFFKKFLYKIRTMRWCSILDEYPGLPVGVMKEAIIWYIFFFTRLFWELRGTTTSFSSCHTHLSIDLFLKNLSANAPARSVRFFWVAELIQGVLSRFNAQSSFFHQSYNRWSANACVFLNFSGTEVTAGFIFLRANQILN